MLGIKTTIYTNQAQPSQWAAGVNQAIAQKPDLIMLQGAPDPRVLQPQLIAAKKAGIPVLVTHFFEESDPMPPNVTALVRVQFNQAARLEADWTIVDSGGKANARRRHLERGADREGDADRDEAGVREVLRLQAARS